MVKRKSRWYYWPIDGRWTGYMVFIQVRRDWYRHALAVMDDYGNLIAVEKWSY